MFKKILVAVDGSAIAYKAAEVARDIAMANKAELSILSVVRGNYINENEIVDANNPEYMKAAGYVVEAKKLTTGYESRGIVGVGHPAQAILNEIALNDIDCVVLGCRGLSGVKKMLLGSVSEAVLEKAKVTVIVVND